MDFFHRIEILFNGAIVKVSNVHPPQPSHQGRETHPYTLSRGDLPSPLVGEGKG